MIDGFPHRNTIKAAVTTVEVQQDKIAAENPRWVGRSPRSPCLIMFCMFRLHKHMFYRADKVEFLRRQNKSREARMPTEHENADFLQKRSECFFQPCCNLFSWHHDACSYCFSLFILWQLTENCWHEVKSPCKALARVKQVYALALGCGTGRWEIYEKCYNMTYDILFSQSFTIRATDCRSHYRRWDSMLYKFVAALQAAPPACSLMFTCTTDQGGTQSTSWPDCWYIGTRRIPKVVDSLTGMKKVKTDPGLMLVIVVGGLLSYSCVTAFLRSKALITRPTRSTSHGFLWVFFWNPAYTLTRLHGSGKCSLERRLSFISL